THALIHDLPLALSQTRFSQQETDRLWQILNYYAEHLEPDARRTTTLYGLSLEEFPKNHLEPALIRRIRAGNLSPHEWAALHAILSAWDAEDQSIRARDITPLLPEELSLLEHFLSEAGRRHESLFGLRLVAGDGGNIPCPHRDLSYCDDERRFIAPQRASSEI